MNECAALFLSGLEAGKAPGGDFGDGRTYARDI
jgi:hypothetical protein